MLNPMKAVESEPSARADLRGETDVALATTAVAPSLESLVLCLAEGSVEERTEAARTLRSFGPDSIEALCVALKDPENRVRSAAAESLGEVGDERAIQPLVDALREGFAGRSPRRARIGGILAGITFPLCLLSYVSVSLADPEPGLWKMLSQVLGPHAWITGPVALVLLIAVLAATVKAQFRKDLLELLGLFDGANPAELRDRRVVAEALARIAERTPTPQLREALPHLREIAADGLQQDKRTRAASRAAARRIDTLTAMLERLPVAATAPASDGVRLPRASEAATPESGSLPRAASPHE